MNSPGASDTKKEEPNKSRLDNRWGLPVPMNHRNSTLITFVHAHSRPSGASALTFNGNYKLIRLYGKDVPNGEEWEFYDLEKDPHELNNIYANPEMSGAVGEMKKALG